ncbi:uncharacterized protein LOC132735547 [Ruditapes philippinarum]|uniref:uncharacterized protein LOC132735547 n=1 Tax=Ruditapes philippinarum TaxID=129788 RepID=UPI00295BF871|nr:uncharacterized protein LOC132735547 [Ruditapes philippinarum]
MKYLHLLFGLAFISCVFNGVASIQCNQTLTVHQTNPDVFCEGSCVKSIKGETVSMGCSSVSLIPKCERQDDLTVCACDSDYCNRSSKTRIFEPFISCIIFLLVAIILD